MADSADSSPFSHHLAWWPVVLAGFAVVAVLAANTAILANFLEEGVAPELVRGLLLACLTTLACVGGIALATGAFVPPAAPAEAILPLDEEEDDPDAALARGMEAESRARSGFLAVMSHEIRTPMNGVLGLAGVLLDTPLNEQQRKMVGAIRDSGDALMRILNDILDFSKLDAGKMALEQTPFSPATLTRSPVSLLEPRAGAKGLLLVAECEDTLPAGVIGDSGRIRQVLLNLVSNAVKFSEQGSVTVHAACRDLTDGNATLVWTVTDTGMGIPADRLDGLFREFMQVDTSISRRFGGSGLGLAISKKIVEQMGGTITVESEVGVGSTFRVMLRLPVTDPAEEERAAPVDAAAAFAARLRQLGRPARLLFAEDNPTNQFVALQSLRGFDVQTDVVADGLEAVHAASSFLYDIICMDMRMPDMDGLSATRAIRARGGHLATVPIIALTANAFPEDVRACFDAGMTGFIAKPVRRDAFLTALIAALDDAAAAVEPIYADDLPAPLDREAFIQMTAEIGEDGVVELAALFEAEARSRLAAIDVPDVDPDRCVREIHSLKGAAAAACAACLSRRAADLELVLVRGGRLDATEIGALKQDFEDWLTAVRPLLDQAALEPVEL